MIELKTLIKEDEELKSISVITGDVKKSLSSYAQTEYDNWEQDEEGYDEELGTGGICELIADKMADVLSNLGIEFQTVSSDEPHVYLVGKFKEGIFEIDIPYHVYESGGGFSWKKKKNVKFDKSDVSIYKLDSNPENYFKYVSNDMMEIKHELKEDDEHQPDTSWQETWKNSEGKVEFIGTCRTALNKNNNPFEGEVTNMAYAVDNSISIDYSRFIEKVDFNASPAMLKLRLRTKPNEFQFGKYKDLIWAWDTGRDIHYFFL